MKRLLFILCFFGLLACLKEVQIEIPKLPDTLVVDGNIEAGCNPIIILSNAHDIEDSCSIASYLNSLVLDAEVSVIHQQDTFALSLVSISALPIESQKRVAEMLRMELKDVVLLPIQVYSKIGRAHV